MIHFLLLVNKHGQTRLSQYTNWIPIEERSQIEGEVVRKCLQRKSTECNIVSHLQYKLLFRRYAGLYVIIAVDKTEENELAILEFIHCIIETFDKHFEKVTELDIMFNSERAHLILEEMFCNGTIVECNKSNILNPLNQLYSP